MLQARPGRNGKQQQPQKSPNLRTAFLPSPVLKLPTPFTRCSSVTWFETDNFGDISSGFMYCCAVEELRNTIRYLPDLADENGNWPALLS